ncbi:MAG: tetratricopeptide repeat protein [Theionarchaea archaeon]|nr:MAG: hypothetical protein AYK18_05315 [Theionarchaea archaeon DG-70]MBU7011882.1 tetratricopeptide repeat protein [Theionarchaea archaeon]
MSEELAVPKLLADKTNIAILLLLRTQPLHCRKLSAILEKRESQIARRLSQLEQAGILESEWIHKGRNIKVYSLKTDHIRLQITDKGIEVTHKPEKKEQFLPLESIFQFDIPVPEQFIDREYHLQVLSHSFFVVLTGIAGIGKTSLASFYAQQLKNEGKRIFWHTFSELDSVLFVVKKLAIFLSKYGHPQLLDYLKADSTDIRVVGALLKDHMNTVNFAFFFDDYQLAGNESMNDLFNQLKKISKGRICVISRYRPPFVSAFDNIAEVRLEEMGPHAVRELLQSKGMQLHGRTLERVSQKIGGHPLALELLCQAAAESDPASIMKNIPSSKIESYLWDEIYSKLSPREQQLLVSISVFRNPVDIRAVKSMCSFPRVRTIINQLVRKNLLKKADGKYVHHSVTRLFCLSLAKDRKELHQKAAQFHLKTEIPKDLMEALHHFIEAGAYQEGAEVLLDYSEMLINEGYGSPLLSFCQRVDFLPRYQGQVKKVEGEIYCLKGEYDEAIRCFKVALKKSSGPNASLYRKLGEVYERKREYRTAQELFEQGLAVVEEDTVEEGEILVRLASVYAALSELEQALSCCERALDRFTESEYKKGIAHVYEQMGEIYRFSNTDRALELLYSSLEISQNIGDVQKVAAIYATVGNVLYERGQINEAATYYEKGLHISEQIGDMAGIARCCNNIGVKYALEWKWPHAVECYHRTLSICQKIKDSKGIAFSYSNLGRAYARLGLWEKAFDCFFASLHLREELGDKREMTFLYNEIGTTLEKTGDFKGALQWIEKSLRIRESIGYTLGVAYCYTNMGRLYTKLGEYQKAMDYFERAQKIHEKEKGTWMIAGIKAYAAQTYVDQKNFEKAVELIEEAIPPLQEAGDIELLTQVHQVAAEAYHGLQNRGQALTHGQQSLQYARTMSSSKYEGRARRVLGMLFCDAGAYERAAEELRLSMRLLKRHKYELARTYFQFAELYKNMGLPKKRYQVLARKASAIFQDLGVKHEIDFFRQYTE